MVFSNDSSDVANIDHALQRIGVVSGQVQNIRLLSGGQSESAVYRLTLNGDDVVLKVTMPDRDLQVPMRALREAWFYRDLASTMPIQVPRLLGVDASADHGVVLLLVALRSAPLQNDWSEYHYTAVARQLAQLHAHFWEKSVESLPDWLLPKPALTQQQCDVAAAQWHALGERDDLRAIVEPIQERVERFLSLAPEIDRQFSDWPTTLCHGDCHIGNVLRGPTLDLMLADWQEVRIGPGVEDLSFFWQRAFTTAPILPPLLEMIEAYLEELRFNGVHVPREKFQQELKWVELRSWILDWPSFLGALSVRTIKRVISWIDIGLLGS